MRQYADSLNSVGTIPVHEDHTDFPFFNRFIVKKGDFELLVIFIEDCRIDVRDVVHTGESEV